MIRSTRTTLRKYVLALLCSYNFSSMAFGTELPKVFISEDREIGLDTSKMQDLLVSQEKDFQFATPILNKNSTHDFSIFEKDHLSKFSQVSSVFRTIKRRSPLNDLFPSWSQNFSQHRLLFLVDSIHQRHENRVGLADYSSLFIRDFPRKNRSTILLQDSHFFESYWEYGVNHELAHLIFRNRSLPGWIEEGVARLVERISGGYLIDSDLEKLSSTSSDRRLSLFPTNDNISLHTTPHLVNVDDYALPTLFASYIKSILGWQGVRALSNLHRTISKNCLIKEQTHFEQAVCRLKDIASSLENVEQIIQMLTPRRIYRYFVIALALNHPQHWYYHIPYWPGFRSPPNPLETGTYSLSRGQFIRVTPNSFFEKSIEKDESIDVYRILKTDRSFEIFFGEDIYLTQTKVLEKSILKNQVIDDFVLIINSPVDKEASFSIR